MKRRAQRHAYSRAGQAVRPVVPTQETLTCRAVTQAATGDHAGAVPLFRECASLYPTETALCNLGLALENAERLEEAATAFKMALDVAPASSTALLGLADCHQKRGLLSDAEAACQRGIASACFEAQTKRPNNAAASAYILLGKIRYDRLDFEGAVAAFRTAAVFEPARAQAHGNLGLALHELGFLQEAFHAFNRAIDLQNDYVVAYNNLAGLLITMGQLDMAISCAKIAVALAPANAGVYLNLALAHRLNNDMAEAVVAFRQALARDPSRSEAALDLCHLRQQACDWDGLDTAQERTLADSLARKKRVSPFVVLTAASSRRDQLDCARIWVSGLCTINARPLAAYRPRGMEDRGRRIRIGYLSADFHAHATAALITEVFERHDKTRFETFGYSLGPDDGSPIRARLIAALDHFTDLKDVASFTLAAKRIFDDRIDILLDLKGYTQNARSEILACRPAPIQVNYLGFPATMGASFIDYLIADRIVIPPDHAESYDEKIVRLPHCYQPNDRQRVASQSVPTRAECGLPEGAFVFCSFNNTYKITPAVFDIWMRLLKDMPGAVLWLLQSNALVASNLRREAEARGVCGDRLVFAPFVTPDRHMVRMACADLFLDTVPVNAHTTASEALWMGLPVLTCIGDTFAGRVASSLLAAVGLSELVTESLVAYEALALALARDPERLGQIRERLAMNRSSAPLFDTERYTQNYEACLSRMMTLRDEGRSPEAFAILETVLRPTGSAKINRGVVLLPLAGEGARRADEGPYGSIYLCLKDNKNTANGVVPHPTLADARATFSRRREKEGWRPKNAKRPRKRGLSISNITDLTGTASG